MRGTFSQQKKKKKADNSYQVINPLNPSESNVRDVINLLHKCDSITKKRVLQINLSLNCTKIIQIFVHIILLN